MNYPLLSPAQVLLTVLREEGVVFGSGKDWIGTYGAIPPNPDNAVTIYDSAPRDAGRLQRTGEQILYPGVQIRIRGLDYGKAYAKALQLIRFLLELKRKEVIVSNELWQINCFVLTSGPMFIGVEEKSNRQLFTINGVLSFTKKE